MTVMTVMTVITVMTVPNLGWLRMHLARMMSCLAVGVMTPSQSSSSVSNPAGSESSSST